MNPRPLPPDPASRETPPEFPLADADWNSNRPRSGEPHVFLSWGGEIYGPAGVEDVLAGIRSAWFEEDAVFWFEGQEAWLPVGDFPSLVEAVKPEEAPPANTAAALDTPTGPPAESPAKQPSRPPRASRRRGTPKKPKPGKRPGLGKRGILIILGFTLLAVGLTVGILLLLMEM